MSVECNIQVHSEINTSWNILRWSHHSIRWHRTFCRCSKLYTYLSFITIIRVLYFSADLIIHKSVVIFSMLHLPLIHNIKSGPHENNCVYL